MSKYEYICIDFETANGNMTSACSVGFICASKGRIVDKRYYLLNPEEPFLLSNTMIHGIKEEDVINSPKIYEVWDEIFDLINGEVLVAHNARFDMSVLKALIIKYNLQFPDIRFADTLLVSRIAFKDQIPNHKLNTISNYLEVDHNHHNALSDAYVCFEIIERTKRMYQVYDIYDLYESINLTFGLLKAKTFKNTCQRVNKQSKVEVTKKLDGFIFGYIGKPSSFTKTEFRKIVEENGGLLSKSISMVINACVIFQNPKKENINALKELQEKKEIKIYNESDFLYLLKHGQ